MRFAIIFVTINFVVVIIQAYTLATPYTSLPAGNGLYHIGK